MLSTPTISTFACLQSRRAYETSVSARSLVSHKIDTRSPPFIRAPMCNRKVIEIRVPRALRARNRLAGKIHPRSIQPYRGVDLRSRRVPAAAIGGLDRDTMTVSPVELGRACKRQPKGGGVQRSLFGFRLERSAAEGGSRT